jgi:hypothetical protein
VACEKGLHCACQLQAIATQNVFMYRLSNRLNIDDDGHTVDGNQGVYKRDLVLSTE